MERAQYQMTIVLLLLLLCLLSLIFDLKIIEEFIVTINMTINLKPETG